MRARLHFAAAVLLVLAVFSAPGETRGQLAAQRADTLRQYGLDQASSLESRVQNTPAAVMKMFADAGDPMPTAHNLTESERRKLAAAFAGLPPLHRRILTDRLRSVSFLDGMPNTALTSTVNPNDPYRLFDITIRAGVLGETVSEFLTRKELTCFDTAGSTLSVSIDAGALDAVFYALLHEATHIVDSSLRITPAPQREGEPADSQSAHPFTEAAWSDRLTVVARFREPLLQRIRFRPGGEVLAIGRAEAVYAALGRTPFASLYGSANWHDDVAELAALYHLTEKLGQPYRIVVRDADNEVFVYEPMKAPLVRARFSLMGIFYE